MGAGLVRAAIDRCAGLDHAPARLFIGMSVSALDDDPQPVYFKGQDDMAAILGMDASDKSRRAVRRSLHSLTSAGMVRSEPSAPGRRARHFLLDGHLPSPQPLRPADPITGRSASTIRQTQDAHRPVSNPPTGDAQRPVNDARMADAQRRNGGRSAVGMADAQRPPEEEKGRKRKRQAHPHEPNAVRSLTALVTGRHLPIGTDELLSEAYRIGDGDPWNGYLSIKAITEAPITGARDPAAALRARLRAVTA